ncbi:MAG: hypothetical protein JW754_02990 [Candidatus Aenigmarchaeota archaeon]|nr:hypothetical protein [Candidatus Aenigmarchaeota archaeon]
MTRGKFITLTAGTAAGLSLGLFPPFSLAEGGNPVTQATEYLGKIYDHPLIGRIGSGGSSFERSMSRRTLFGLPAEPGITSIPEQRKKAWERAEANFRECFGSGTIDFGGMFASVAAAGNMLSRISRNRDGCVYLFEFGGIGEMYMKEIMESASRTDYPSVDRFLIGFEELLRMEPESFETGDTVYIRERIAKDREQRPKSWTVYKDTEADGMKMGDHDFATSVERGRVPDFVPVIVREGDRIKSFGTYRLDGSLTDELSQYDLRKLHEHVVSWYDKTIKYTTEGLRRTYEVMKSLG